MRIVLTTHDVFGLELSGTFSTERATAETIVSSRFAAHGVARDRNLLEWLRRLPESAADVEMPSDSPEEERMEYALTDLIERQGDIIVRCSKCDALVPLDAITTEEKDFCTFAGDLYRCPNQHGLLFAVTKIF